MPQNNNPESAGHKIADHVDAAIHKGVEGVKKVAKKIKHHGHKHPSGHPKPDPAGP